MGTIADVANLFDGFRAGFENEGVKAIQENSSLVEEYITQQLFSGVDGEGKPLRPTYSADPWFDSYEADIWQGRAKDYKKWKQLITAPARSWLGHPERDPDTPNLIITGTFYESIKASPMSEGVTIDSISPMGGDIEHKYGSSIFKPDDRSREHFVVFKLLPRLIVYFKKWGLVK